MHDVVAPPVQLVRCPRRTVEAEKAPVERVRRRQRSERRVRKDRAHLLLERLRVQAVDVVVAVVGEEESAGVREGAQRLALRRGEANELVPGHEDERERRKLGRRGADDDFVLVDRDRCVLDDRIEDVGGDFRVVVPVAGVVPQTGEDEFRAARTASLRSVRL